MPTARSSAHVLSLATFSHLLLGTPDLLLLVLWNSSFFPFSKEFLACFERFPLISQ